MIEKLYEQMDVEQVIKNFNKNWHLSAYYENIMRS